VSTPVSASLGYRWSTFSFVISASTQNNYPRRVQAMIKFLF